MLLPGIIGAQRGGGYPSRVERGGGPGNGDTRFGITRVMRGRVNHDVVLQL